MNSADTRRMKIVERLETTDQPIKGYELSE